MAGGLAGFFGFGRSRKTNLVPDVARPKATDLYFNKPLRELATRRIAGEDLGFGNDFVNKATNPTIQAKRTRLNEEVIPSIGNAASARGINRSSLTVDQIGRAERDNSNEIDQLLSQFEVLNKQQSKQDQNNAITLGRDMDNQEAGMRENEAAASERLVDKTAGRADALNVQDKARQNQAIQAVGSFASPMLNDLYAKANPNAASVTNAAAAAKMGYGVSGVKTATLGSTDIVSQLLKSGMSIEEILNRMGQ